MASTKGLGLGPWTNAATTLLLLSQSLHVLEQPSLTTTRVVRFQELPHGHGHEILNGQWHRPLPEVSLLPKLTPEEEKEEEDEEEDEQPEVKPEEECIQEEAPGLAAVGGSSLQDLYPTVKFARGESSLVKGVCGAHLAYDAQGVKGIFKPASEEGLNERGEPLKRGVRFGDTAIKERAAFVLGGEFGGVPHTTVVQGQGQGNVASLQEFVQTMCSAEDMSSSKFPLQDVQRLGALDIRLLNLDRHEGNVLVAKDEHGDGLRLVPIDHGYSFPSYHDLSDVYFGWQFWQQAKQPWDAEVLTDIKNIDSLADAAKLDAEGLPYESILASLFSTVLLQHCAVDRDMSLFEISKLVQAPPAMLLLSEDATPEERAAAGSPLQKVLLAMELDASLSLAQAEKAPWLATEDGEQRWADLQASFLRLLEGHL